MPNLNWGTFATSLLFMKANYANFSEAILATLSLVFILSACSKDDPTPATTISAPSVTGTFMPGSELSITFTTTGTFEADNVFTIQLSDGTGSFSAPVTLGTTDKAGTVTVTLRKMLEGEGYRIRVVASKPEIIGNDNGSNLSFIYRPS